MKKEDGSDTYGLSQIGDILGRDFEIIARKWMEKEREQLANASNAHRSELRNQIPKYLKALGMRPFHTYLAPSRRRSNVSYSRGIRT